MQNANRGRRDPKVVAKELREAEDHMRFCIELYRMQLSAGRYFIHEHPEGASSWNMHETIKLLIEPNVGVVSFDMCQFGMKAVKKGLSSGSPRLEGK